MERLGTAVAPHGLYHFVKATDAALNPQPGGHHVSTPAHRDHESAYAVPPERKQPAGFRFDEAYEIRARVYEGADLCSPGRVLT